MNDPHYGYHVFWYSEYSSWVARCIELPSISGVGDSPEEASVEARIAVALAVTSLKKDGEMLPESISIAEWDNSRV